MGRGRQYRKPRTGESRKSIEDEKLKVENEKKVSEAALKRGWSCQEELMADRDRLQAVQKSVEARKREVEE